MLKCYDVFIFWVFWLLFLKKFQVPIWYPWRNCVIHKILLTLKVGKKYVLLTFFNNNIILEISYYKSTYKSNISQNKMRKIIWTHFRHYIFKNLRIKSMINLRCIEKFSECNLYGCWSFGRGFRAWVQKVEHGSCTWTLLWGRQAGCIIVCGSLIGMSSV